MKLKLTTILLGLFGHWANAQVTGTIVTQNGENLPFVNVLLLNPTDSTMIKGGLSDINGQFELQTKYGQMILQISMINYEDWYSPVFEISASHPVQSFNQVKLAEESTLLEGMEVTAQKMAVEQTMEGMTVNVQSSMAAKGSTALQIIERSPGVVLDRRYNNLTLNGQSGTLIMINGRAVRMAQSEIINMLSGMSADNLEKVELLTNPSSKYDSDGGAGIINLVIKKSEDQGTNGSVSTTVGYGKGPKEALSLNFNHRRKKTNYFGSYSINHDDTYDGFHAIGHSTSPAIGGRQSFDFASNTRRNNLNHNSQLGIESNVSERLIVGGNVMYNHSKAPSDIYNDANYSYPDGDFLHSDIYIDTAPKTDNLSTTLFIEQAIGESDKLNIDADYIYYHNFAPTSVESKFYDIEENVTIPESDFFVTDNRGGSTTKIKVGVVKVDFTHEVNQKMEIELGVKGSLSITENDAFIDQLNGGNWERDLRNVNDQHISEKIGAAYASWNYSLDSLTRLSAGVRYEHWDRDFSDATPDQNSGQFFPSIFLSRKLLTHISMQVVYNRRVTRPGYSDLTTYLRYNDPFSVFTGNPNLKSAITDNFKLSVQIKDKSVGLIYSHVTDPIARFQVTENETKDLSLISPQNLAYHKSLGLQTHFPIQVTDAWMITLGGTLSARKFEVTHTQQPKEKTYLTANLYGSQDFTLPKSFSIELSGFYNAAHYNGSVENEGFGMMNLGLKKEFENTSSLQFTITDVLQTMNVKFLYGGLTEEAWNSYAKGKYTAESGKSRIFKITYFKSFGSNKIKAANSRNRGSKEEQSRVGQ